MCLLFLTLLNSARLIVSFQKKKNINVPRLAYSITNGSIRRTRNIDYSERQYTHEASYTHMIPPQKKNEPRVL